MLSTAWQRMATFGRRRVRGVGSHLSSDGGGFLLRRPPLGSGWLRLGGGGVGVSVATCRQTVEVFYCAVHRLAADGYVWEAACSPERGDVRGVPSVPIGLERLGDLGLLLNKIVVLVDILREIVEFGRRDASAWSPTWGLSVGS